MIDQNEQLLKRLLEKETKLHLASRALHFFGEEVNAYKKTDLRYVPAQRMLLDSRYKLSAEITDVACKKAMLGIVGNTWYKKS